MQLTFNIIDDNDNTLSYPDLEMALKVCAFSMCNNKNKKYKIMINIFFPNLLSSNEINYGSITFDNDVKIIHIAHSNKQIDTMVKSTIDSLCSTDMCFEYCLDFCRNPKAISHPKKVITIAVKQPEPEVIKEEENNLTDDEILDKYIQKEEEFKSKETAFIDLSCEYNILLNDKKNRRKTIEKHYVNYLVAKNGYLTIRKKLCIDNDILDDIDTNQLIDIMNTSQIIPEQFLYTYACFEYMNINNLLVNKDLVDVVKYQNDNNDMELLDDIEYCYYTAFSLNYDQQIDKLVINEIMSNKLNEILSDDELFDNFYDYIEEINYTKKEDLHKDSDLVRLLKKDEKPIQYDKK